MGGKFWHQGPVCFSWRGMDGPELWDEGRRGSRGQQRHRGPLPPILVGAPASAVRTSGGGVGSKGEELTGLKFGAKTRDGERARDTHTHTLAVLGGRLWENAHLLLQRSHRGSDLSHSASPACVCAKQAGLFHLLSFLMLPPRRRLLRCLPNVLEFFI